MAEDYKAIICRAIEEIANKGNLAAVEEYFAPDYVGHFGGFPEVRGIEALKQFMSMNHGAFTEKRATIEQMIAEGDTVAVRITWRGKHTGDLMGIAPTGKEVTLTGIAILRFANGKIVEHWANPDAIGLLRQLGVSLPFREPVAAGGRY
jgi:predicted ester cyclase